MRILTIVAASLILTTGIVIQVGVAGSSSGEGNARTLSRQALEDKIRGGWAGQ